MSQSDIANDLPAIVEDKGYRAYTLKKSGASWEEISSIVGFPSAKAAYVDAYRYMTKAATILTKEQREEVLAIELDRLDSLLQAVWADAMTGDTKAVDSALKVINVRAKLLSLDQLTMTAGSITNNTVVVTGNSQDFIRSLKLVDGYEEAVDE